MSLDFAVTKCTQLMGTWFFVKGYTRNHKETTKQNGPMQDLFFWPVITTCIGRTGLIFLLAVYLEALHVVTSIEYIELYSKIVTLSS